VNNAKKCVTLTVELGMAEAHMWENLLDYKSARMWVMYLVLMWDEQLAKRMELKWAMLTVQLLVERRGRMLGRLA
jgi:hypothetical protein